MILIYCVFKNKAEGQKIAKLLIEQKLAACINLWEIDSCYRWKGAVEQSKECAAFIKTKRAYFQKARLVILKQHSYETTCIIEIAMGRVSEGYSSWLNESLK